MIQLSLRRSLIATNNKVICRLLQAMLAAKKSEPSWAFIHRQLAIAYGRAGHIAMEIWSCRSYLAGQ